MTDAPHLTDDRLIARGATADVYRWCAGWVLKVFQQGRRRSAVEAEARRTKAARDIGLPVPACGGIIEINGRLGLPSEMVEGPSLMDRFASGPWRLWGIAHMLAQLQWDLHRRPAPEVLPPLNPRVRRGIEEAALAPDTRAELLEDLHTMPAGKSICHGDFHPGNILLSPSGPVIIDWCDAASGPAAAGAAQTWLLLAVAQVPPGARGAGLIVWLRRIFREAYLRRYLEISGLSRRDIQAWIAPLAAHRLALGIADEREALLQLVRDHRPLGG